MDGIARVTVDPYVMEYVMHCMYDTFLKIQKGLHVSISWHREGDTVLLTSTSRPATRDLHHALNRFFVLYNTLRRNLSSDYCQLHERPEKNVYIINKIREKFRRIYIQNINDRGEIKLWGFKSEINQALEYAQQIFGSQERRLKAHDIQSRTRPEELPNLGRFARQEKLPKVKQTAQLTYIVKEPSEIFFSESLEKKLSNLKSRRRPNGSQASPPSRYSTTEIRRLQQKTAPKKVSTFPKIVSQKKRVADSFKEIFEVQTPTGLVVSTCLREAEFQNTCDILVTEISSIGRLSDEESWRIAKNRSFEIMRIIKLHISLYGEVVPSKIIVTPGYKLSCTHLIHAAPPSWDERSVKKCQKNLLNTYRNVLRVADRDLNCKSINIPVLGRCSTAGAIFPETVAFATLQQAIVSCTKFGFRNLRHIQILCARHAELEFIKTTVFTQIATLQYDPRYLAQQLQFLSNETQESADRQDEDEEHYHDS